MSPGILAFRTSQSAPTSTSDLLKRIIAGKGTNPLFAKQIRDQAGETLHHLRPKIKKANAFLSAARKRYARKQLCPAAYLAESAPLNMAVSLYDTLLRMEKSARKLPDASHLARVTLAAAKLSGRLDKSSLMVEGNYPDENDELFCGLAQSRITEALSMHRTVCETLADSIQVLGVTLPNPPQDVKKP